MKWSLLVLLLVMLAACDQTGVEKVAETEAGVALLKTATGAVTVNGAAATAGRALAEGDVVATAKGTASIVFKDSAVLRLGEDTEIVISDVSDSRISLGQTSGQTWTRLLRIAGVDTYTIDTPTTVATVRGTAFKVSIEPDDTEIAVQEGAVEVMTKERGKIKAKRLLRKAQRAWILHKELERIDVFALQEDAFIGLNLEEDELFIEEAARRFAKRHPRIVDALRKQGLSEEAIHDWIEHLATGDLTKEALAGLAREALEELEELNVALETELVGQDVETLEQETAVTEDAPPDAIEQPADGVQDGTERVDEQIVQDTGQPIDETVHDRSTY